MNDLIFENPNIRFKIENNIDNLGVYKWLFDVECDKLVIGLNCNNEIVIKNGKWISGSLG